MTTKIDYALSGCANGHPARIKGTGSVAKQRLRIAFTATELPFSFDTGLAHFAGFDALAAVAAGLLGGLDGAVVSRCRTDFLGEGGVEVGTIVALATVERRRGRYRCEARLAEARVAMEVGERLTSIGARTIIVGPQAGEAVLLSATTISTSRGRELTVMTTTALVGASVGRQMALVVRPVAVGRGAAVIRLGSR